MREEAIKKIIEVFNVKQEEIINLNRFEKGMSNYTFSFEINKDKYVIRLIGLAAEKYVDYNNELNVLNEAIKDNITSELIYFDALTGTKISKFIEGVTNNNITDIKLVKTLKKLHSIKSNKVNEYNLIDRLEKYQGYNNDSDLSDNYHLIKKWWLKNYTLNYEKQEKVLCHNDLQNINIIRNQEEVYLIDFEYASYNDIYYEFASYEGNKKELFKLYYNREITKMEENHIRFYEIYQSLQWYQVALYKDKIGFSKLTNYNFKDLANYFIQNAYEIYEEIKGDY